MNNKCFILVFLFLNAFGIISNSYSQPTSYPLFVHKGDRVFSYKQHADICLAYSSRYLESDSADLWERVKDDYSPGQIRVYVSYLGTECMALAGYAVPDPKTKFTKGIYGRYSDGSYYSPQRNPQGYIKDVYKNVDPLKDSYEKSEWQTDREECMDLTYQHNENRIETKEVAPGIKMDLLTGVPEDEFYSQCIENKGWVNVNSKTKKPLNQSEYDGWVKENWNEILHSAEDRYGERIKIEIDEKWIESQ